MHNSFTRVVKDFFWGSTTEILIFRPVPTYPPLNAQPRPIEAPSPIVHWRLSSRLPLVRRLVVALPRASASRHLSLRSHRTHPSSTPPLCLHQLVVTLHLASFRTAFASRCATASRLAVKSPSPMRSSSTSSSVALSQSSSTPSLPSDECWEKGRAHGGGHKIGPWEGPFPSGHGKKVTPEHSLITLEMICACSFVNVNLHA